MLHGFVLIGDFHEGVKGKVRLGILGSMRHPRKVDELKIIEHSVGQEMFMYGTYDTMIGLSVGLMYVECDTNAGSKAVEHA